MFTLIYVYYKYLKPLSSKHVFIYKNNDFYDIFINICMVFRINIIVALTVLEKDTFYLLKAI